MTLGLQPGRDGRVLSIELLGVGEHFTNTETTRPVTLPPIDEAGESPKGLGWDGNKPLMRNRTANEVPSPIGNDGGNTFERELAAPSLFGACGWTVEGALKCGLTAIHKCSHGQQYCIHHAAISMCHEMRLKAKSLQPNDGGER